MSVKHKTNSGHRTIRKALLLVVVSIICIMALLYYMYYQTFRAVPVASGPYIDYGDINESGNRELTQCFDRRNIPYRINSNRVEIQKSIETVAVRCF